MQLCGEFEKAADTVAGIKCLIALKVPRLALIFLRIWLDPGSRVGRSRYIQAALLIYRGIRAFPFPIRGVS